MLRWSLCHLVDPFGKHTSFHVQRSLHSFPTYLSCMFLRYHTCCMNCNRFHWSNISCCPDQTAWCSPYQQLMCMSCTSQLCLVCPQLGPIVCQVLDQRFYSIRLSSIQLKIKRKKKFGALKWDLNPWSKEVFNWSKNNFQMVKLTYPKGWTTWAIPSLSRFFFSFVRYVSL